MVKSLDIGKFTISFGINNLDCFGLGFEFYTESDAWYDKELDEVFEQPIARIIRFDLLLVYFNITYWIEDVELEEPNFN